MEWNGIAFVVASSFQVNCFSIKIIKKVRPYDTIYERTRWKQNKNIVPQSLITIPLKLFHDFKL